MDRREFLGTGGACAAHLALAGWVPPAARLSWARARGQVVAREPFGNLERVADGIWALVSTPLSGDRTTLSNGGIIAGTDGVLAIEGFNTPEGAAWLAGKARELTGRGPTHVALTHYHSDHSNGVAGYLQGGGHPVIRATRTTRDEVLERNRPADAERTAALSDVTFLSGSEVTTLDLGGRIVTVTPRDGHTDSDVSLVVEDPHVIFCGDLYWNGMFPNFVDAIPTHLARAVRAVRSEGEVTYVPGHGALSGQEDYDRYVDMLDVVEEAARSAHDAGQDAEAAATDFRLPDSLGEWILFGPTFFPRAFTAWYRELGAA